MTDEIVRCLKAVWSRFNTVKLAYLFGSRAGMEAGPSSDYDIAVLIDRQDVGLEVQNQLALAAARALGSQLVDVVLLNTAPVELAYAVIAQGVLLYQRDAAVRVEYEARVMALYGDYLPFLRRQRSDILKGDDHGARVQRYREALRRTERTLGKIGTAQRQAAR